MSIVDDLRKKFVIAAVLSIMIVIISIYGAIALNVHYRNTAQLTEIAKIICDNNGNIPDFNPNNMNSRFFNRET